MVQFIGNSIHFNGKGILDGKLVLPNRSGVIGNGSLFKAFLPFSAGTFANASDRYITAKNPTTGLYEITGPFGANVLATRNISGDVYGLFEKQYATENTHSEVFRAAISNWLSVRATVTDNSTTDPLGNATADTIVEDTSLAISHLIYQPFSTDGSSTYIYGVFLKAKERSQATLNFHPTGMPGSYPGRGFDLSTGTSLSIGTDSSIYGILPLSDGWYYCYIGETSDAIGTCYIYIQLAVGGSISYDGDGTSGLYVWGANVIKADHLTSYIQAVASTVTKSPDVFYFPSSAIPTWMKSKFTTKLIPNYDIPLTTEDKPLWSFNKAASTLDTGHGQHGMAVDSSYLYWANLGAGKIQRIPIGGGTATDHVTGLTNPWGVQVNATDLFWSDITVGKIQKCPVGGGSVTDVVTGLSAPYGLAITATEIFWADRTTGKIQKCPIGGGSVTDIATGLTNLTGLAVDSNYIYYAEGGSSIKRIPVAGGTAVTLASSQSNIQLVHADDWFVYWGNLDNDKLQVVSKQGGAVATLIDLNNAYGCTTLDGALFYSSSDAGGTIARRDSVTAWLTTTGTIKVVEGPDTKVETSAATASIHQNVEVKFDRANGKITLSGFTSGDGEYTDTAWTSPDGFDVQYGCALGGAAQSDALVSYPKG